MSGHLRSISRGVTWLDREDELSRKACKYLKKSTRDTVGIQQARRQFLPSQFFYHKSNSILFNSLFHITSNSHRGIREQTKTSKKRSYSDLRCSAAPEEIQKEKLSIELSPACCHFHFLVDLRVAISSGFSTAIPLHPHEGDSIPSLHHSTKSVYITKKLPGSPHFPYLGSLFPTCSSHLSLR